MPGAPASQISIVIADDHAVVRAGIAAMIANETDMAVVAEAGDGAQAVALYAAHHPDVVLMDLRMPMLDGVAATRAIRAADPAARVVALTTYDGDTDIHRALSAGACAYLVKDVLVGDLIGAIRSAASGRRVIPAAVAARAHRIETVRVGRQAGVQDQQAAAHGGANHITMAAYPDGVRVARLALAAKLFRAALKRLDFVERAQARARSNGRVRFPA